MRSTSVLTRLLPLVPLLMMTACATSMTGDNPRSMANMSAAQLSRELAKPICDKAWKPLTYSSTKDTSETVDGVRANNRAREAFCHD